MTHLRDAMFPFLLLVGTLAVMAGCSQTMTAAQQDDVQAEIQGIYNDGVANNQQAFIQAQAHAAVLGGIIGAPVKLAQPAAGTPPTPTVKGTP